MLLDHDRQVAAARRPARGSAPGDAVTTTVPALRARGRPAPRRHAPRRESPPALLPAAVRPARRRALRVRRFVRTAPASTPPPPLPAERRSPVHAAETPPIASSLGAARRPAPGSLLRAVGETLAPPRRRARSAHGAPPPDRRGAAASSARAVTASAPCPGAGSIISGGSRSPIRSPSPSRTSPAVASRMAAHSGVASSLASRVSTLPRMSCTRRSGRACSSCARRRRLLVAIDRALGQLAPPERAAPTSASRDPPARRRPTSDDARRKHGRQILERVDGEVDPALEHRVVDLPGEERAAPIRASGTSWTQVAGGPDLDPLRRSRPRPSSSTRTRSVCQSASALPRVPTRRRGPALTGPRPLARADLRRDRGRRPLRRRRSPRPATRHRGRIRPAPARDSAARSRP